MENTLQKSAALKGGEWLIKETNPFGVFTTEDLSDEQRMIGDMCQQFIKTEVAPCNEQLEKSDNELNRQLMKKAGDLGILGVAVPEAYGGLGKDFITGAVVANSTGGGFSFGVTITAHMGIGTLPILYFGTEEQKQKYIPKLASGEWIGAYGLTEPNSGSDALSIKTSAKLSDDGKYYILNGQKCWITNGGFADVYTVFAKVDGDKFTGFIIERDFEGFTRGPEEKKMGIKGSSTVQLYFQDCKVPVENVLGEIGKGHHIAFNALNIGRFKLSPISLSAAKHAVGIITDYANTREQFKTPIASFGAIQHKLAEMAIKIWTGETAVFRTGALIQHKEEELLAQGNEFAKALIGAAEEYAIECAILKINGSEILDFVVDEGVQIHGGNGFSGEYVISQAYRDSRINRIYEGTNEINRLLIMDMIMKRAMGGRLDFMGPATAVAKELMSIPDFSANGDGAYEAEKKCIANFKKAILMVAGAAAQKLMMKLEKEQEILMNISDMVSDAFIAESALLHVIKTAEQKGETYTAPYTDMMRTFLYDAADRINKAGKDALNAFAEGDELRMMHIGLKRFTKAEPYNTKEARRRIAARMINANGYCF